MIGQIQVSWPRFMSRSRIFGPRLNIKKVKLINVTYASSIWRSVADDVELTTRLTHSSDDDDELTASESLAAAAAAAELAESLSFYTAHHIHIHSLITHPSAK